ncbi:DUF99 family protein [Candidatus Bathyarchaeota archaeon]|nr:DUF99 family protein [Candidatus Bathyarchaeota archaeon]
MSLNVSGETEQVKVIGVEDGGFPALRPPGSRHGKALLVCVQMDGPWIEAVQIRTITVDGTDATSRLLEMLKELTFDAILLGGISFAGFNLIDPCKVYAAVNKPVIVISKRRPDNVAVKRALVCHFEDWAARWEIIEKLEGGIHEVLSMEGEPPIYIEVVGAKVSWAQKLIRNLSTRCRIPEPIRVARFIARGLTRGLQY